MPEDIQAYSYGFELLFSTLISMILILADSIVLGVFPQTWLYLLGFIPVRLTAGGFHAKHHWSCICATSFMYVVTAFFVRLIPSMAFPFYNLLCSIFLSVVIWTLSPVEAINKPLSKKQSVTARNRSIVIASFNMAICLFAMFISVPTVIPYLSFYMTGAGVAGISLIVAKRERKSI